MNNIIVYVDDAAYALRMLQSLRPGGNAGGPVRWIVVGCAPRVTHRVSKWVTHSARESWRGKSADKVFTQLQPLLQQDGDTMVTLLDESALPLQTKALMGQYRDARVLDARRPKCGQDIQPVAPPQVPANRNTLGYLTALLGSGLLVAAD